jgi:hypothetical protein
MPAAVQHSGQMLQQTKRIDGIDAGSDLRDVSVAPTCLQIYCLAAIHDLCHPSGSLFEWVFALIHSKPTCLGIASSLTCSHLQTMGMLGRRAC